MEIRIGKAARGCAACGREFTHEQELVSLVRVQDGALLREDYCVGCWDESRAKGAYSVWNPRFYDPRVAEAEPPEAFSPLRQLFYEAVTSEDRSELAKAFLAAQLLRRQKVFRLIKEAEISDGGGNMTLYADRIGNRLIEVHDPSFSFSELDDGRKRLVERLQALEQPADVQESGSHGDA